MSYATMGEMLTAYQDMLGDFNGWLVAHGSQSQDFNPLELGESDYRELIEWVGRVKGAARVLGFSRDECESFRPTFVVNLLASLAASSMMIDDEAV